MCDSFWSVTRLGRSYFSLLTRKTAVTLWQSSTVSTWRTDRRENGRTGGRTATKKGTIQVSPSTKKASWRHDTLTSSSSSSSLLRYHCHSQLSPAVTPFADHLTTADSNSLLSSKSLTAEADETPGWIVVVVSFFRLLLLLHQRIFLRAVDWGEIRCNWEKEMMDETCLFLFWELTTDR